MDANLVNANAVQIMRQRRAIRDYLSRPVEQSVLETLIEDAVLAPSAMNRQAWSFTVIRDRKLLNLISTSAKAFMLTEIGKSAELAALRPRLQSEEFNIFYNAPAAIVISATAADAFATYDCCLAAANLMHAACEQGLGSCWIGIAEGWLNTPEGKLLLRVPPNHHPVATLIVGYPRTDPQTTARRAPQVTWIGD